MLDPDCRVLGVAGGVWLGVAVVLEADLSVDADNVDVKFVRGLMDGGTKIEVRSDLS